jgi:hypothetical protein
VTFTGAQTTQFSVSGFDAVLDVAVDGAGDVFIDGRFRVVEPLTVNLVGSAVGLSVLGGINGESLKFGTVDVGSTEVLPLTVTNVGLPGTVTIGTAITVRATTHPATTYKVLATAQNTCLAGIAPGESCTLAVEFAPTISGTHDDLLILVPSPAGGSTTVWLTGSTP